MVTKRTLLALSLCLLSATTLSAINRADLDAALDSGTPQLLSAGPLVFGPEGILFIGDSQGAAIFALATEDSEDRGEMHKPIDVAGIDGRIAALAGTTPDQIRIHDLAVNPASGQAYLSASRGQGPEAVPLLVRVDSAARVEVLSLQNVRFAKAALTHVPDPEATGRRGRPMRRESITDLAFVDDTLLVTGLSNEEFSSRLRTLPFPFSDVDPGTTVEIYHGSHGRWETNAPVRAFVKYDIKAEPYVLAAYTCTPLVKFPLSELKSGAKLVGTTVAELGNRNRPLDMVVYQKNGQDFLLMANSSRGVMKVDLSEVDSIEGITQRIATTAGLDFETVSDLEGVEQLDLLDKNQALILVKAETGHDLKTVALP